MSDQVEVLAPNVAVNALPVEQWPVVEALPLQVMDERNLAFLHALSTALMADPVAKTKPELVALGFWLRPRNLQKMFARLLQSQAGQIFKPVGTVVHFTPANVDTMFVYSWVCSMLCGNNNIVRIASAQSDSKTLLLKTIRCLLEQPEFDSVKQRNWFVSYAKTSIISRRLSAVANARVIWGGDDSVNAIRQLPCKPRCRDISFADRYSASLLDLTQPLSDGQLYDIAQKLWRDTQPYQQQACSSPRVLYFLGNAQCLTALLQYIDQLAAHQDVQISRRNNQLVNTQLVQSVDASARVLLQNNICAMAVAGIQSQMLEWHGGEGVFYVRHVDSIDALLDDSFDKLQTLSYWGISEAERLKLFSLPSIVGIDRVVPVGQALEFSPVWDSFDLISQLTRCVVIR